jgi:hypothetical protein
VFVVGVASRRGFVIVLSLCEDKTSFPPPLFSLCFFVIDTTGHLMCIIYHQSCTNVPSVPGIAFYKE